MRIRIDDSPIWETVILPLLYTNGSLPRERIEMRDPENSALRPMLQAIPCTCCSCGALIYPIRARAKWGSLYLTVSCDRDGCCRGSAAAEETARLRDQIHGWEDPQQPGLFDRLDPWPNTARSPDAR